jgi:hypothetical protein
MFIHVYLKCYNEKPCIAILKQTKMPLKNENREQKSKTGYVWGVGTSGKGEDISKRSQKVNMVKNLHTCMKMDKQDC